MEREQDRFVLELLSEYKKSSKRWFIMSILLLIALFATIGFYEFKEASYDYITIAQDGDLNNINSGEQGSIINGDSDSELLESGGVVDGNTGSENS